MATTSTPKIAIVGAGPVGLTLAAILHRSGIESTIFERESSATVRAQGGTLDIHADGGQRALVAAGLLEEFRKLAREEGEAMRILTGDGRVVLDENEEQGPPPQENRGGIEGEGDRGEEEARGRPEIDRRDLKDLLIAALPKEYVRWGKGIKSITPVPGTAQWMLDFMGDGNDNDSNNNHDDESGPYDLVLGADGAWSRVRPLLTDVRPLYSGVTSLDVWISAEGIRNRPDVAAFIGKGTCLICSEGRSMALQRHGDGSARAYVDVQTHRHVGAEVPSAKELLRLTEEQQQQQQSEILGEAGEVDWTDEKTRRRFLDTHFADWAREPVDAVLAMTEQPTLRPLYMLPVGHRWEGRPGVSLLGDAAHLMTPFAGAGVNVGMTDALELAQEVVGYVNAAQKEKKKEEEGADDELARVLRRYEEGMFERLRRDADFTAKMMRITHEDGGAERIRDIVTGGSLEE